MIYLEDAASHQRNVNDEIELTRAQAQKISCFSARPPNPEDSQISPSVSLPVTSLQCFSSTGLSVKSYAVVRWDILTLGLPVYSPQLSWHGRNPYEDHHSDPLTASREKLLTAAREEADLSHRCSNIRSKHARESPDDHLSKKKLGACGKGRLPLSKVR